MIAPPPENALRLAVAYAAAEFAQRRQQRSRTFDETLAWRELIACLVGGATRHQDALAATEAIYELLPSPWDMSSADWGQFSQELGTGVLTIPTRFPREHSRYLVGAVEALYVRGKGLCALLQGTPKLMRTALVRELPGIGPKQASLLLLNLAATEDVAVLDRHVLRYMTWIDVIDDDRPPRTLREYEVVEALFRDHARSFGFAVVDVDRAVWLTSRVWGEVCQ